MSKEPIKEVLILGGGTAGWLTALYLNKAFGENVRITLVESPKASIIGVGEATLPTLRFTMKYLDFSEAEWMPLSQASYKAGVRFQDWKQLGHHFYHPFHKNKYFENRLRGLPLFPDLPAGPDALQVYANIPLSERKQDFAYWASPAPWMCDRQQAPLTPSGEKTKASYAYHFDTFLLNQFFRQKGLERGIHNIKGHFVGATQNEKGYLESIQLEGGASLAADLFIDCTGFRSLLIQGVLGETFKDSSQYLLCDSAVAVQIPYKHKDQELKPYTSAQALPSGWVWRTPLQHRLGTGYVYSSQHISKEQAWEQLQGLYPKRADGFEPRYLPMRVGRLSRSWVKNCVAIGLSHSFIEPLESTAIGMTEYQIHTLLSLFPDKNCDDHLQLRFNEKINHCYDDLKDFIIAHYYLSERDDSSFWKEVRQDERLTDTLKDFLANLKPWVAYPKQQHDWSFFQRFNWACILSGMGALPHVPLPILDQVPFKNSVELTPVDKLHLDFPKHAEFLETYRQGIS